MWEFTLGAIDLLGAAAVLVTTICVGTVAHELTHAMALRALGIPYDLTWLPGHESPGRLGAGISKTWATVTPMSIPTGVPPNGLRLAAVAPLVLATPLLLVLVGVLPDPVESGDLLLVAATVAWFGCALPSPQDFSMFWYPERAMDDLVEESEMEGVERN